MSSGIKLINGRNTLLTDENSLKKKNKAEILELKNSIKKMKDV